MFQQSRLLKFLRGVCVGVVLVKVLQRYQTWKSQIEGFRRRGVAMILENPTLFGFFALVKKHLNDFYEFKLRRIRELKAKTMYMAPPIWISDGQGTIVTIDPANVKHILQNNVDNYLKPSMLQLMLNSLLGNGIFVVNHGPLSFDHGKSWEIQRKTTSKIFTRNLFKGNIRDVVLDHGLVLSDRIRRESCATGKAIEFQSLFFKFTLDTIGRIGFGVNFETLKKDKVEFADSFDAAQQIMFRRLFTPGWNTVIGKYIYPSEYELRRHVRVVRNFAKDVLNDRKSDPNVLEKHDILSRFIALRHQNESKNAVSIDDQTLIDVILSNVIAGRDTTATLLTFLFLIFTKYPELQEKTREEIHAFVTRREEEIALAANGSFAKQSFLPQRSDYMPTLKELSELPYLDAIIKECLRIYPPVPSDVKYAVKDDYFPDGTFIPAGIRVTYEPMMMGRNPDFWEDPLEVRPERWFGNGEGTKVDEFSFPVFQSGPRRCLGRDLAYMESKFLTFMLIKQFRFRRDPTIPVPEFEYVPGITISCAGGLPLIAEEL